MIVWPEGQGVLRKITMLAGVSLLLFGCGADTPPAGAQGSTAPVQSISTPAQAQPSPTVAMDFPADEPPPDLSISPADACAVVDGLYQTLDAESRQLVVKGVKAEAAGDTETVREALKGLRPLFTSVSRTFLDTANKVRDEEMKAVLTLLSETVAQEATFTSFGQFESLARLFSVTEATLKSQCAAAGYTLVNVQ
jgi:hypothetical protein